MIDSGNGANRRMVELAVLLFALAACGTAPDSASTADVGSDSAGGHECLSNSDCPDDVWCVGPAGCDAVWTCVPETPCSAAPPFRACSCGGIYDWRSAGCPGARYAYSDSFVPDYLMGSECSGTEPLERGTIRIRGEGFNDRNDLLVFGVLEDHIHGHTLTRTAVSIRDGAFELSWYSVFETGKLGYTVHFWFDLDSDGSCGMNDQAHSTHVSQAANDREVIPREVVATVGPTAATGPCPNE